MADKKPKNKQSEFVRWFAPLLQALKDLGGSATPREALERIAEIEKVPDALRNEVLSSGQERFYNQVHWARQYLVWESLIDSGKRGVWTLTPKGLITQLGRVHSISGANE
jgi:restriction system protein